MRYDEILTLILEDKPNVKFSKAKMSQPDILLKLFSQINQITQINAKNIAIMLSI